MEIGEEKIKVIEELLLAERNLYRAIKKIINLERKKADIEFTSQATEFRRVLVIQLHQMLNEERKRNAIVARLSSAAKQAYDEFIGVHYQPTNKRKT